MEIPRSRELLRDEISPREHHRDRAILGREHVLVDHGYLSITAPIAPMIIGSTVGNY